MTCFACDTDVPDPNIIGVADDGSTVELAACSDHVHDAVIMLTGPHPEAKP